MSWAIMPGPGVMSYAAASGPLSVQGNTAYQTAGTNPSVLLTKAPASGNLLVAYLYTGGTITATPAGWTLVRTDTYGYRQGYLLKKISDGTETGLSATIVATNYASTIITEWSGAVFGALYAKDLTNTQTAVGTAGPNTAPISPKSIPLAFVGDDYGQGVLTPSSPWTIYQATSSTNSAAASYLTQPAPNTAVSLTLSTGAFNHHGLQTVIIWMDPA